MRVRLNTNLYRKIWFAAVVGSFLRTLFIINSHEAFVPPSLENDTFTIILPTVYREDITRQWISVKSYCPFKCNYVSLPNATDEQLATSRLIVWHLIWTDINITQFKWLSLRRHTSQIWAFFSQEPPEVVRLQLPYELKNFTEFNGYFNWTITYRSDSEILNPIYSLEGYETLSPGKNSPAELWHVPITNKRQIAALISNCDSYGYERIKLLESMRNAGLTVDIFGKCGQPCPHNSGRIFSANARDSCKIYLANNYLFYASFENSLCPDYISEKFGQALEYDMVPIVVGGANYSNYGPPNSYINLRDFASLDDFVVFIKNLSADEKRYNAYFQWRSKYRLKYYKYSPFCEICERLYREEETNVSSYVEKVYHDFDSWWRFSKPCKTELFRGRTLLSS